MEGTLKGIHILVVEDDPDTRELLKVLLQMQGGAVTTAASVRARDREKGSIVPAIALTAYTTAIDRDTVLSAGFQVHMPKPFEPARLISVIADLASKYK